MDYEELLRFSLASDNNFDCHIRPGDLVVVSQRRSGVEEIMLCIKPNLKPVWIHGGPCVYSLFLTIDGKLERILNELHVYTVIQGA